MPSKKEMTNFYEKEYIIRCPSLHTEDSKGKASQILAILNKNLHFNIHNIVELGCGATGVSKELAKTLRSEVSVGCDISKTILQVGKKINKRILLVNADCEQVPIKSDFAEIVLLVDIIEHVPHPEKTIAEARRISKKFVVIKTTIEDCFYHRLKKSKAAWRSEWKNHWGHIWQFSMSFLLQTLDQTGLKPIQISLCKYSSLKGNNLSNVARFFLERFLPSSLYYRLFPGETLILCERKLKV